MAAASANTSSQGTASGWVRLLPLAVGLGAIVIVFLVAFFPSINWMAGEWSSASGALSHGYLVAAISVVLFVRAVPAVAEIPARPAWWAAVLLLGMSLVWLLGYVATVVAVQTVLLPAILLTAIVVAYGLRAARPLAFPALYIYFAIPAWEHLNFVFQAITVSAVGALIRLVDIPALLHGNFVQLSSGTFEIAGGCSGLSFIVAGLSLAVLYGHFFYTYVRQKLALAALALLVAMIGNWIRVFTIIVIGYQSNMQSPLVADHLTLGWILFGILMVPVYLVARRFEEPDEAATVSRPATIGAMPRIGSRSILPVLIAIVIMIAGPVWAMVVATPNGASRSVELTMPPGSVGWTGPDDSSWEWAPLFAGPDAERVVQYGSEDTVVLAYSNLYLSQVQDKELIYFSNNVAGTWQDVTLGDDLAGVVRTREGREFRQVAASNFVGTWLIWYRFQIGEVFETSDAAAKLTQALNSLKGRPEAGIIAFATPCRPSCAIAAETLQDYVAHVGHRVRVTNNRDTK